MGGFWQGRFNYAIASAGKSSTHANAKKIQDLIRLKSIGPEIGTTLVGEVFYRQFNNRQQLGSYVELTPSHFQSGPLSRDQGISKAGNPKARTVMIELAWLWLRHQPNGPLSIWFRERVGTAKGRIRRIAIVAVARKLLIALWRYLETGVVPTATTIIARHALSPSTPRAYGATLRASGVDRSVRPRAIMP
jgi:transposase